MNSVVCTKGSKGRFRASGIEFEVIDTTPITSTIRFHGSGEVHELADADLRKVAESIEKFS